MITPNFHINSVLWTCFCLCPNITAVKRKCVAFLNQSIFCTYITTNLCLYHEFTFRLRSQVCWIPYGLKILQSLHRVSVRSLQLFSATQEHLSVVKSRQLFGERITQTKLYCLPGHTLIHFKPGSHTPPCGGTWTRHGTLHYLTLLI